MNVRFRFKIAVLAATVLGSTLGRANAADAVVLAKEGKQPQAAVDDDGSIHVVYGLGTSIRHVVSRNGGKSFGEPSIVGESQALALGMRRGPRVAVTRGAIVVTAIGGAVGLGKDGDLLAWRSIDRGKTWSKPIRLNDSEASAREGLHATASGPDGEVASVWLDLRNQRTEIFGVVSTDGGATWGPNVLIYQSPSKSVCECCHPSVAFGTDGELLVMWRNQVSGNRDLYLTRSKDGGKTFENAEKLGEGTWSINACPMDGGAIVPGPNGSVSTIWTRRDRVFLASPGSAEKPIGRGVQGWAARGSGGLHAVWLSKRPGTLLHQSAISLKPGVLSEKANDPMVASSRSGDGTVVAVWEEREPGASISGRHHGRPAAGPAPLIATVLSSSEKPK